MRTRGADVDVGLAAPARTPPLRPDIGIPVARVARVVARAITARRPRARYLIGADARAQVALGMLPTWLRDWLIYKALPPFGDAATRPAANPQPRRATS